MVHHCRSESAASIIEIDVHEATLNFSLVLSSRIAFIKSVAASDKEKAGVIFIYFNCCVNSPSSMFREVAILFMQCTVTKGHNVRALRGIRSVFA